MSLTDTAAKQDQSVTRPGSGILGLNRDILFTITQYCLSHEDSESIEIPPTLQSQQLILCQVCRSLRSLILTSPSLWTRFTFTGTKLGQHRELFKEWLSRAEGLLDSFPISIENREGCSFSVVELEEFVLPYSDRLLRLHLYLEYEALDRLFHPILPIAFPRLANFSVICSDFQQPSLLDVEPIFRGSPVEEFAMTLGPPVLIRGLGISWAGLRVLRLIVTRARFYFPISWIHAILNACRETLETCSISLEPTTDPDLPRLTLPHLNHLSIHFRDSGWKTQAGFFNFLSLPSLLSLELSCYDGLAFNEACSALKSFFHRSSSIRRLCFERTPSPGMGFSTTVNSLEVVNILTLLSNLRSIHLPKGPHTNIVAVLEAVLLKGVCPFLETMEITVNNGMQVVRVIQALWNETAGIGGRERSIRGIKLVDPKLSWIGNDESSQTEDPDIAAVQAILRELKDEGLVVTLTNTLEA
ncbi:hypothetical protein D9756_006892 [Leucocoprinus leucothites]|uniref:F-box domain-containing protein n=1 Tax=Leucocoprinus leucothites TaxID=201217 RepID=A0A8H5D5Y2_9AGAR|nr:hypothetical protein D9756_006892 [Leucoagaricus leucothites]